jgi:hypothetical protein
VSLAVSLAAVARALFVALAWLLLGLATTVVRAQPLNSATIAYTAPTQRENGTPITGALTYRLWQGLKDKPKVVIAESVGLSMTVSSGLLPGREYCWHVTAVEAGAGESKVTNDVCQAFVGPSPTFARCAPFEDREGVYAVVKDFSVSDAGGPYIVWSCYRLVQGQWFQWDRHCMESTWAEFGTNPLGKLGSRAETIRKAADPIAAFDVAHKRYVTRESPRCTALFAQ